MTQTQNEWEAEMPPRLQAAINRVRDNPAPGESVERFIKVAEGIEMTAAEWQRGGFTKWIWGGALLSLLIPPMVIGMYLVKVDTRIFGTMGAGLIAMLVFVDFFWNWIQSKRNAGPILLECGKFPSRRFFILMAAFYVALTIYSIIFVVKNVASILSIEGAIAIAWIGLCVAILVYQCMSIWGRLQFRANGIWCYIGLVPWTQVVSWNWTGSTGTTLLVQRKSRFGILATGAVPIPLELKAIVEELMTTHTGRGPLDG